MNSFGNVLRDKDNPSSTISHLGFQEVGRTVKSNNNPIPSGLTGSMVSGGGGVLTKGQKGLLGFSSSLKQGDCGLGPGRLSQISGSYCSMDELNKWSSSIPCKSAAGQAGEGIIGGVGLEQTNEEAGILPGRPTATGTTSLAGGPLLPSDKLLKGECKLTSTTMMTEEDSLSEVVEEVYTGQSRQSEYHLPQCTVPSCGILRSTPSRFDMPKDSLSLASGETYGGRSNRLPEHFPSRGNNMTAAIGALSITASHLGKSADSLSLAAGEVYVKSNRDCCYSSLSLKVMCLHLKPKAVLICAHHSYRFTITS